MPDIRDRFERNTTGPIELAPRPDHKPDAAREVDVRLPYQPSLPKGFNEADEGQLSRAHSGAREQAKEIRRIADEAWRAEPRIQGVALTPAQRLAWKREHVKAVVQSELEKTSALLKPIVECSRKDLESRRAKLIEKGTPKLDGIPAQRALQIADHFARLDPERRTLMAFEAMNAPEVPENRELLAALAWSHPSMELVPADTRARIQGVLVASADPEAYASVTTFDTAIQATDESLNALKNWAASLSEEIG